MKTWHAFGGRNLGPVSVATLIRGTKMRPIFRAPKACLVLHMLNPLLWFPNPDLVSKLFDCTSRMCSCFSSPKLMFLPESPGPHLQILFAPKDLVCFTFQPILQHLVLYRCRTWHYAAFFVQRLYPPSKSPLFQKLFCKYIIRVRHSLYLLQCHHQVRQTCAFEEMHGILLFRST